MNTKKTNATRRAADEAAFAQWRAARRVEGQTLLCAARHRARVLAPAALALSGYCAPLHEEDSLERMSAPVAVVELGQCAAQVWALETELEELGARCEAWERYCAEVLRPLTGLALTLATPQAKGRENNMKPQPTDTGAPSRPMPSPAPPSGAMPGLESVGDILRRTYGAASAPAFGATPRAARPALHLLPGLHRPAHNTTAHSEGDSDTARREWALAFAEAALEYELSAHGHPRTPRIEKALQRVARLGQAVEGTAKGTARA